MKVYLWGTGKGSEEVLNSMRLENCDILGFIDNDPLKQGKLYKDKRVLSFKEISDDFDYLIVTVINYDAILYQLQMSMHENLSRIIVYFEEANCWKKEYAKLFDEKLWRISILEHKVKHLENIINIRLNNIGYEIVGKLKENRYQFPRIGSMEEAINKIVYAGCSMVRYGDGEFEIMAGKNRAIFQEYNEQLQLRLSSIIKEDNEKLLIGIANNYGSLDAYTVDAADGIRDYMQEDIRKFHLSYLKENKVYYDAYMFKCYLPWKNKEDTAKRVGLVKKIWDQKDVVIIEGDKTRTGYGNDLLDNAKSIKRILAPTTNAFDKYNEILEEALKLEKNHLILAVLGPAAKLLVYDLMNNGYQAVDIGQIDMDYDWYQAGVKTRVHNPYKYVSQMSPAEIYDVTDEEYQNQILVRI